MSKAAICPADDALTDAELVTCLAATSEQYCACCSAACHMPPSTFLPQADRPQPSNESKNVKMKVPINSCKLISFATKKIDKESDSLQVINLVLWHYRVEHSMCSIIELSLSADGLTCSQAGVNPGVCNPLCKIYPLYVHDCSSY